MERRELQEIVIEPGGSAAGYWRDLWSYRELFLFLAWRDILVRYKQTVVGVVWCLIKPVLTMIVFTVVFGQLAKLPSSGVPYPVLVFAGLLPWQFFSGAVTDSSNSLVSNGNLLSKVYFPRLIVPASAVVVSLLDFLIAGAVLGGLLLYYQCLPSWRIVFLPLFLGLASLAAFGGGLMLAALNVRYRDFRHIVPFLMQFGLYVSPVGFSSSVVPERWRPLYYLNPMAAVIDGFRWAILGDSFPVDWYGLLISSLFVLAICVCGIAYFRRTERSFADVV